MKQRLKAFRDNYLAATLLLLLLSFGAQAQTFQKINAYGYQWQRGIFDSGFYLPKATPVNPFQSGGLRYNVADSSLYVWTGFSWIKSSGSIPTLDQVLAAGNTSNYGISVGIMQTKKVDGTVMTQLGDDGARGFLHFQTFDKTVGLVPLDVTSDRLLRLPNKDDTLAVLGDVKAAKSYADSAAANGNTAYSWGNHAGLYKGIADSLSLTGYMTRWQRRQDSVYFKGLGDANGVNILKNTDSINAHNVRIIANTNNITANTAAIALKADKTGNVNAQTGTTYTLTSSDNGKVLTFNNASGITLTVPSGLGAGFNCLIVQLGAGQVTFTASSTTINNRQALTKTAGQYAVATLVAYTANTFLTSGDMQ